MNFFFSASFSLYKFTPIKGSVCISGGVWFYLLICLDPFVHMFDVRKEKHGLRNFGLMLLFFLSSAYTHSAEFSNCVPVPGGLRWGNGGLV